MGYRFAIESALRNNDSSPEGVCWGKENIVRSDRFIGFLLSILTSCVIQSVLVPRASGQDGVEVPVSLDLYYCGDIDQPAAEPGKWEPTARDFHFDLFLSQSNVSGDGSFLIYTTNESDPRKVTCLIKSLNEGVVRGDIPLHPEEVEYVSNPVVSSDGSSIAYWAKDLSGKVDIYIRTRIAGSMDLSEARGIHTPIPGTLHYLSNDAKSILIRVGSVGGDRLYVLNEDVDGVWKENRIYTSGRLDYTPVMSGDGKWVFFHADGDSFYSHYENGAWKGAKMLWTTGGENADVSACNYDATWLDCRYWILHREGDVFEKMWEFEPPAPSVDYPQISEDGRTVAFTISESVPSRPYWDGSIAPYPMMSLYVARLEEQADGEPQVQLKVIDMGKGISFRLYGDGRHILWAVTNTRYASSVQGWRGK